MVDFHKQILFSDEAHFWLNGYVNKQNCRIWSEANPQVYVETPLHPEKLTGALYGLEESFCKNDEGHNVTVNGDRYRAMITNFFIPELNNHDVQELWFQQDGATCHTARATIDLLKDTFGDRLISRFGPVNWPPRSCDLTPLDYVLWSYVKSLVYADKPQTLDHLEDNIRRVIAHIRPQMLEKSSKIGRPDWTTSEPAVAVLCQKSYLKLDATPVSCELRGPFTFTYSRGHGECQYPLSTIDSCTDDSHLLFRFQACADVLGTESSAEELTCTAVWKEGSAHYLVGKISTKKNYKQSFTDENAYRCFVFDFLTDKGVIQMSQSADATCDGLVSPWEGSRTMRLTKSKHPTSGCQFPSWVTTKHKWRTLDGETTYTFGAKNNSFKLTHSYQDQEDDTKFICIEHVTGTANSSTVVAYSSSGW
ncbi:uncharacterized protein TNCV_4377941 [Trichonephila clavipes]|nr:uncharacterized protein TNCV_4377941 [Trichonephila clavipes]